MLCSLLALTLAASPLEGYGVRGWSIDDGLPQSSVTAIAQDTEGWLHLGTFGGLARFDGHRFEVFGASDGEGWSTVRITALAVGDDGTRWLGLQSGDLVRIDVAGRDHQLAPAPGLGGRPIWAVREIDGMLWAVGSGGAARWDGATWTPIDGAAATRAVVQHGGVVWLGGTGGLGRIDGELAIPWTHPTGEIYALASRGDSLLMVGEHGVTRLLGGATEILDPEAGHDLAVGADGTTYVASGGRVRILGEPGGVRLGSRVRDMFVDREQVLWVGTDGDGLRRLLREDWSLLEFDAGTLPLLEVEGGALVIGHGCEFGGVVRADPDGSMHGLGNGCVRSLARRGAEVWMGIGSAVARLRPDDTVETVVEVGHNVLVVQPVGDDVFIGTETGGAMRLRAGALEPLPIADARVLAIEPGTHGEVWIGGQDGLTLFDRGKTTRWTRRDGAPAGEIRALRVDADGTVFVGTYGGGLGVLRDGRFRRLTRTHGLTEDVVSAILDDGRGALWLHGNRGLSRLMRGDLEAWLADPQRGVTVRRWATPEGNGGGQPAGIVMRDGSLALSTIEGVVRIDPRALPTLGTVPSLSVLHAEVDGVPLSTTAETEIPAGPGHVELEFTAAILRHPELASFEYRVFGEPGDGTAPPWQRAGDERRMRWAGFLPGRYRIELRVTNESGVVSPTTSLAFVLAQPWHGRWSVRGGIALALVLLVGGALAWRARLARAHLLGLQREIDQRLAAEAEARGLARRLDEAERLETVGRLAGGIAHDFNNLFAAIRGATSMLAPPGADAPEDIAAPVRTLEACVDRGARLTGQLLSFAGRQHLDADAFDLGARVIQMRPMIRGSLPESIALHVEIPRTPMYVLADAAALELAVAGLVLNARDAVPAGGSVTIRLRELGDDAARERWPDLPTRPAPPGGGVDNSWLVLEIEDDGIGIPADRLGKVLEPFFSTRTNATGLGLPSVLGFATQSGGALRLASTEGKGTCVSLVLPRALAPAATPRVPRLVVAAPPSPRGRRVVVVDDDEQVREALTMMLRRAGHHVTAFGDPREALVALRGELACELLVSDIIMPGMTGGELAAAVLDARPGTPMLFVSGFTRDVDAAALPGPLLAKPFGSAEVLAAVDSAIAGQTRQRPA